MHEDVNRAVPWRPHSVRQRDEARARDFFRGFYGVRAMLSPRRPMPPGDAAMKPRFTDWLTALALAALVALVGVRVTDQDARATIVTDPAALRAAQLDNRATR